MFIVSLKLLFFPLLQCVNVWRVCFSTGGGWDVRFFSGISSLLFHQLLSDKWTDLHKITMFCQQMVINHLSEQSHMIEVHVTTACMCTFCTTKFNAVHTWALSNTVSCWASLTLQHHLGGAYCRSSSCPEHQHAPSQSSETAPSANTTG